MELVLTPWSPGFCSLGKPVHFHKGQTWCAELPQTLGMQHDQRDPVQCYQTAWLAPLPQGSHNMQQPLGLGKAKKAQITLVLLSLILLSGKGEAEQTLVSLSETRDGLLRKCSTITSLKEFGTSPLQQCRLPSAPKLDWQIPPGLFLPGRLSTPSINPESHVLDIN